MLTGVQSTKATAYDSANSEHCHPPRQRCIRMPGPQEERFSLACLLMWPHIRNCA